MESGKITVEVHQGIGRVFRAMPFEKQERYNRIFTALFVEGAIIQGFFEEVMEEVNDVAERGALTPPALMEILDESYEDLLAHRAADEAEKEGEKNIPWAELKKELDL